jgi:hypothetical protein
MCTWIALQVFELNLGEAHQRFPFKSLQVLRSCVPQFEYMKRGLLGESITHWDGGSSRKVPCYTKRLLLDDPN